MLWLLFKREGPVFAGWSQSAQHSILPPCATANCWGAGFWPEQQWRAVSPPSHHGSNERQQCTPLCSGKTREPLQISENFSAMKLEDMLIAINYQGPRARYYCLIKKPPKTPKKQPNNKQQKRKKPTSFTQPFQCNRLNLTSIAGSKTICLCRLIQDASLQLLYFWEMFQV